MFQKRTREKAFHTIKARVAVPKKGLLRPYPPMRLLQEFIAYNSTPIGTNAFDKHYNKFLQDNFDNPLLVVKSNLLSYGRGGSYGRGCLTSQGFVKFAKDSDRRFQFCSQTIKNFMLSCMSEMELVVSGKSELNKVKTLIGRELPTSIAEFPINSLYVGLAFGTTPKYTVEQYAKMRSILGSGDQELLTCASSFSKVQGPWPLRYGKVQTYTANQTAQVRRILASENCFYLLQMSNNYFYAGSTRAGLVSRFGHDKHSAFRSKNFIRFYGIYLITHSDHADAVGLENDFFLQASKILNIEKKFISRLPHPTDNIKNYGFKVKSPRKIGQILESCFLDSPNYRGIVEPITEAPVLSLLKEKLLLLKVKRKLQG